MLNRLLFCSLLMFTASCSVLQRQECRPTTRNDIVDLRNGGKLRILQLARAPTQYTYKAHCSVKDDVIQSCTHQDISNVAQQELESIDKALAGLKIHANTTGSFKSNCAFLSMNIKNG